MDVPKDLFPKLMDPLIRKLCLEEERIGSDVSGILSLKMFRRKALNVERISKECVPEKQRRMSQLMCFQRLFH